MTSEAIEIQGRKGTKIEGLFGMFDILGYKSLIKKDSLVYKKLKAGLLGMHVGGFSIFDSQI